MLLGQFDHIEKLAIYIQTPLKAEAKEALSGASESLHRSHLRYRVGTTTQFVSGVSEALHHGQQSVSPGNVFFHHHLRLTIVSPVS